MGLVPCLVYSRICGYLTATKNWNKGKLQEYAERINFKVPAEGLENGKHVDCERERPD